jgi:hypothetical protein
MSNKSTFNEILEAVEHLPVEQQSDLVEVIRRRLAERGRKRVVADVQEARAELASGNARATSVDDLMKELGS